jgi:uncharacterized membrane protein YraQ (UPF0718 family)
MFEHAAAIAQFVAESFLHIWPYLLVTIPIAVAVRMSGAAKYIDRALRARPVVAIVLATLVGAFSPFCSCGVIPIVAALLIGGVPLAPVMAFWIASPSMDPEIFFLSVGTLGWQLAVWRLASTLVLSLSAGFITLAVVERGWLGKNILRVDGSTEARSSWALLKSGWGWLKRRVFAPARRSLTPAAASAAPGALPFTTHLEALPVISSEPAAAGSPATIVSSNAPATCSSGACAVVAHNEAAHDAAAACGTEPGSACAVRPASLRRRLANETWAATTMVVKFMALAFFLEALIMLYVPSDWIVGLLGNENPLAIPTAALLGVPVYTSNLAALPLIGGLLAQGMNPGAALAFLIAGPTTTLPAMAAVWGLASRRVFALYVSFSLVGAVALGLIYSILS